MHARIIIRGYQFTAAGDQGQVSVYDDRGQRVVTGLRDLAEAERWAQRQYGARPEKERHVRPPPQIGRSSVTGY